MVLCAISLYNTRMDIAAIYQRDNKNYNHSLIEKNTEIIVFDLSQLMLLLITNYLPQK